jgi:hypothetical protein
LSKRCGRPFRIATSVARFDAKKPPRLRSRASKKRSHIDAFADYFALDAIVPNEFSLQAHYKFPINGIPNKKE